MKKSKGYTREFRSDDPSTYMTNVDQQKAMLLDTIDDAKPKKINKYVEPEIDQSINSIAESRLKYEARKFKKKSPEISFTAEDDSVHTLWITFSANQFILFIIFKTQS